MSQLTLNNSHKLDFLQLKVEKNIIFPQINSCVYYTCSIIYALMIALNLKRYRMLERHAQQNFVLNTIWMIISNATLFYLKWRCFVNKLLVDDAKKVCRGQRVEETASQMKFYTPRYGEKDYKSEPLPWTRKLGLLSSRRSVSIRFAVSRSLDSFDARNEIFRVRSKLPEAWRLRRLKTASAGWKSVV